METKKRYHISWRTVLEIVVAAILIFNVFAIRSELNHLENKIKNSTIELIIKKDIINTQNE